MAAAAPRTPPPVDLSMLLNQAGYALAGRLGAALEELGISVRIYCVWPPSTALASTQ